MKTRRAPASSTTRRAILEALDPRVPRGAHGVRVGDQLIEAQVGDVDNLAESEAGLAGRRVLDATPPRLKQMLTVHHVTHADDERAPKLLTVSATQGTQLLGLLVCQLTDGQVRRVRQRLIVTLPIEDQGDDVVIGGNEFLRLLRSRRLDGVLEGRTQFGHGREGACLPGAFRRPRLRREHLGERGHEGRAIHRIHVIQVDLLAVHHGNIR